MTYPILKRPVLCKDNEIALMKVKMGNALTEKKSIWDLDYKKISMTALGGLAFVGAVFCFVNVALGGGGALLLLGLGLSAFSIYITGKAVNRINLKREDHRALVVDSLREKNFVEVVNRGFSKDQIVGYKLLGEDPKVYVIFEKMMKSYRSCLMMPCEYEKEYAKKLEQKIQPFENQIRTLNERSALVLSVQEKDDLLEQRKEVENRMEDVKDIHIHSRKGRLEKIKNYTEKRIKELNDFFHEFREGVL